MAKKDKHIIVDIPRLPYSERARLNIKILEIQAATQWRDNYYADDFFKEYAKYLINLNKNKWQH